MSRPDSRTRQGGAEQQASAPMNDANQYEVKHEEAFASDPASFPMLTQRIDITQPAEKHTHDFLELAFIMRGRATHTCAHGTQRLTAGSVVLTGIGAWHSYVPDPALSVVVLRLGSSLLADALAWCMTLDGIGPIFDPTLDESTEAKIAVGQLDPFAISIISPALYDLTQVRPSARGSMFYRISRFFEVLHGVHDVWLSTANPTPTTAPDNATDLLSDRRRNRAVRPEVRQAATLMRANLQEPPSVESLAHTVGLSTSQLERVFAADLGLSPTAYLVELRFKEFTRLLRESRSTIADAASRVGWQSASHAGELLRRRTGMTPTQYRREHLAHRF